MASNPQHEPTMEEILASIRKIISEDSTEAPPPAAPIAEVKAAPEADVLELTQEVHEEPPPAPTPMPVTPVRMAPKPENDIVFETIEEAPVSTEAPADPSSHEGIFSDKTRKALENSFANIEPDHDEPRAAHDVAPLPVDARSVEAVFERAVRESFDPVLHDWLGGNVDLIVEHMKPAIREWMDEHFPALLEGAVRAEVERVVKARGTKR
jgi:cell pole-organizing protein PopZ